MEQDLSAQRRDMKVHRSMKRHLAHSPFDQFVVWYQAALQKQLPEPMRWYSPRWMQKVAQPSELFC